MRLVEQTFALQRSKWKTPAFQHAASQLCCTTHYWGMRAVHRNISEIINLYSNHCLSVMFPLFTVMGSDRLDLQFWRQNDASCFSDSQHWYLLEPLVCSDFDCAPCAAMHKTWGNWLICSAALDACFPPKIHDDKNIIHMVASWHQLPWATSSVSVRNSLSLFPVWLSRTWKNDQRKHI